MTHNDRGAEALIVNTMFHHPFLILFTVLFVQDNFTCPGQADNL